MQPEVVEQERRKAIRTTRCVSSIPSLMFLRISGSTQLSDITAKFTSSKVELTSV